jgi:hypothetical protein
VNAATVALVDRPYQEIVDDILTAIIGGVVNEPIFFDVKMDLYPLSRPAVDIRTLTGSHRPPDADQPVRWSFVRGVDYDFDEGRSAVVWLPDGNAPEDETTFYVDYVPVGADSPLTDINIGSVTRTLTEAIGREVATVYQQINQAYLAGFIDTAERQALDLVVSILNVQRQTKDDAVGLVTFFRNPAVPDNIIIPAGTVLTTADGKKAFATVELRALQRGQVQIEVPIRAMPKFKGALGLTGPNTITVQAQPVTGIDHITNLDATVQLGQDETDEQLRARARAVVRGLSKGTIAALVVAATQAGAGSMEVWDPGGPAGKESTPGRVTLLLDADPEHYAGIQAAVEETRAAGVQAALVAHFIYFTPRLVASITAGLPPAGKIKVVRQIVDALDKYARKLSAGAPAKGKDMIDAINKAVPEASKPEQIRFVDVMAWRADVSRPGTEATIDALLAAVTGAPVGDTQALRVALANVLTQAGHAAPTSQRIPDRSLVQKLCGGRTTDADIEAGDFQVVATVQGASWFPVLDMDTSDVLLVERS